MRWPVSILSVLGIVAMLSGCSRNGGREGQPESTAKLAPAGNAAVSVEGLDEAGLKRLIENRAGRILFLNVWATWCVACVEEFPDIVKLSRSYDPNRLEVVAISTDYPDEVDSKIVPFLRKQNVPFKVYVAKFDDQEKFINALDTAWSGALPATFIYDTQGHQRFKLVGQGSYGRFKQEIEKLRNAP
jgi:thiol-disulfide isomerase/thioredoxin